jgi:hypothetical protein
MLIVERHNKADRVERIAPQKTDLLKVDFINSRSWLVRLLGGDSLFDLEVICVKSGALAFNVCGMRQTGHIGDISEFVDHDGNEFEIDDFFTEE